MVYMHPLSPTETKELESLYHGTHDADTRIRCLMILLFSERQSVPQIARLLRFSDDAVRYWIRRYEAEGIEGLSTRPRSGRPPGR